MDASVPTATRQRALALLEENTVVRLPPLCPEIQLHLLRDDAPVWHASEKHLFDDAGLRPYWAFCWASGQALARYLLDNPDVVRGRRVLDFGAGCGITAIAAAKAGAARVIAAEIDPLAVVAIEVNARLNGVTVETIVEDILQTGRRDWEVLLAADVCYWSTNAAWLHGLAEHAGLVLISDPGRPNFDLGGLRELARYRVRTVPDIEHHSIRETAVYCLCGPGDVGRICNTSTGKRQDGLEIRP
jgi:predicted nicotinamide N-methyase